MSREEEKLLTIALKNSLREQNSRPTVELSEIEEMKTYYPTKEEFEDPVRYIESLYKDGASDYGCIKIVPPEEYRPPCPIDETSERKLPSRFQTLQELSQAKVSSANFTYFACL